MLGRTRLNSSDNSILAPNRKIWLKYRHNQGIVTKTTSTSFTICHIFALGLNYSPVLLSVLALFTRLTKKRNKWKVVSGSGVTVPVNFARKPGLSLTLLLGLPYLLVNRAYASKMKQIFDYFFNSCYKSPNQVTVLHRNFCNVNIVNTFVFVCCINKKNGKEDHKLCLFKFVLKDINIVIKQGKCSIFSASSLTAWWRFSWISSKFFFFFFFCQRWAGLTNPCHVCILYLKGFTIKAIGTNTTCIQFTDGNKVYSLKVFNGTRVIFEVSQ